jgi:hypothetical protein
MRLCPLPYLGICNEDENIHFRKIGQLDWAWLAHEECVGLLSGCLCLLPDLLGSFQVAGHPQRAHHDACRWSMNEM